MKRIFIKTKQEVNIGDVVDIDGIKISISKEFIDLNPDMFKMIEDIPEYVKVLHTGSDYTTHLRAVEFGCTNFDRYQNTVIGKIYKVLKKININGNAPGYILEYNGKHYIKGIKTYDEIICIENSTKEEFDRQELLEKAKRDYPIGTRAKSADTHSIGVLKNISYIDDYGCVSCTCDTLTIPKTNVITIYSNELDKWAEILKPILKTEDDIDIYEGDTIYLADSFQVIDIKVSNNTSPTDPKGKLFANKDKANEYHKSIKVMTLCDYENLLMSQYINNNYSWFKIYEPKLYWTKILLMIADELNEGLNDNYEINYDIDSGNFDCSIGDVLYSAVQFDSENSAKKAISIMGDELKFIFE